MKPVRVSSRTIKLIVSLVVAALVAGGVIQITGDPAPSPAPTATPTPAPARAAAAAATPAPLVGQEHEHLAEPGDTETGLPRSAAPAAGFRGCTTALNTHNFSARGGARAQLLVAHWTASRNVTGWADVDGNQAWLNQPVAQASANFIIDFEGHCKYTVPVGMKAWTQAAANPYAVSIEFVGLGTEPGLSKAATAKGGLVFGQVARQLGIPVRRGATSRCVPTRSGIVDHKSLGACGGGHPDIGSWPLEPLIAAARTGGTTAVDRVTCRKLNWWRSHGRPHGKPETNAVRRRKALDARGVLCTKTGPVLRA